MGWPPQPTATHLVSPKDQRGKQQTQEGQLRNEGRDAPQDRPTLS